MLKTALALLAIAAVTPQSHEIRFTPVKDAETVYELSVSQDVSGSDATFTADITRTIAHVAEDGTYVVRSQQSNGELIHEGQPITYDSPPPVLMTFGKEGWVLDIGGEDVDSEDARFANLTAMAWPAAAVDLKGAWTVTIPAVEELGTVPVKATYTLQGPEKVKGHDALKISFSLEETESTTHQGKEMPKATASGTIWIEVGTGRRLKHEAALKNSPLAGEAVDGKFTLVIKEPKP